MKPHFGQTTILRDKQQEGSWGNELLKSFPLLVSAVCGVVPGRNSGAGLVQLCALTAPLCPEDQGTPGRLPAPAGALVPRMLWCRKRPPGEHAPLQAVGALTAEHPCEIPSGAWLHCAWL